MLVIPGSRWAIVLTAVADADHGRDSTRSPSPGVPAEGDVALDLDDTLLHKSGRRVDGAAVFRDAVRSATKRVVYALGLHLVVVTFHRRALSGAI